MAKAGAVGVPLNFRLVGRELSYQIENADVVCIIYGNEFIDRINSIKGNLSKVKNLICDGNGGGRAPSTMRRLSKKAILKSQMWRYSSTMKI